MYIYSLIFCLYIIIKIKMLWIHIFRECQPVALSDEKMCVSQQRDS